ncbi:hypothetical protein ICNINCKA_02586 [Synechococcus sp. CBW1107]|nr:hypothetical protein ICNINCKA_02586 [Synechococcus sp. CBW1107]
MESLGTIHLERQGEAVQVQLIGTLESSAYERIEADIDAEIQGLDGVWLLLDLRQFDGWAGIGPLGHHLALAEKLVSRFFNAETRLFEAADHALAETWIQQ